MTLRGDPGFSIEIEERGCHDRARAKAYRARRLADEGEAYRAIERARHRRWKAAHPGEAQKAYKRWRAANPELARARTLECTRRHQALYAERKLRLIALFGGRCVDCGFQGHPAAFHFDHRDPETKSFGIAEAQGKPWECVLAEARKCDLVCANCHAVRTATSPLVRAKWERRCGREAGGNGD
jgi:hypothetical protein